MKRTITTLLFLAAASFAFASTATAADFEVQGGISSLTFTSDAMLETFSGNTSQVGGTLTTDLSNPSATTGTVTFATNTLRTGIDMRDEHLVGEQWLDAANHPNITFELTSVDAPEGAALAHGETLTANVTGTLTIKGTSQTVTAPADVTFYEIDNEEVAGTYGIESDVLRIESTFDIALDDYGVSIPGPLRTKVSNEIELRVRLTATHVAADAS